MDYIKKFLKKEIILNCKTESDAIGLFKKIKEKTEWCSGDCIDEDDTYWNGYDDLTCYFIENQGMVYCDIEYFEREYRNEKFIPIVEYVDNKFLVKFGE